MRNVAIIFQLLLLAMLGYIFFSSAVDLKPQQRMVPLIVAVPTALMLLLTIAGELSPKLLRQFNVSLIDFMPEMRMPLDGLVNYWALSLRRFQHRPEFVGRVSL